MSNAPDDVDARVSSSTPTSTQRRLNKPVIGIHVLVVFLPVAFALGLAEVIGYLHISPCIILFFSIVALVPIANCISASTDVANEKLKINGHPTLSMLLNVTFANVVEIIVALIALFVQRDEVIALYSLIGIWISNDFLLMDVVAVICSFKGCTFRGMNETTAQTHTLLLLLASAGYMLASALPFFPIHTRIVTAQLSLGVAIMFVVLYAVFVFGFQLRTHKEAMAEDEPSSFREGSRERKVSTAVKQDKAPDHANLSVAVLFMFIWTGLAGAVVYFLLEAATTLLKSVGISKIFFALIILPVFGNLFEHWTAITAALKGNLTGAFNVAAGSVKCPDQDKNQEALEDGSQLGDFFTCIYFNAEDACTYSNTGDFVNGPSNCPEITVAPSPAPTIGRNIEVDSDLTETSGKGVIGPRSLTYSHLTEVLTR
ncbi:hypothetical protein R3P38DRAFT_3276430 [Favolaschia claudopus]|uniref:Sodium/calcium exchanger membrane region domain-containing protein n=2 Tax=Favolaschia claudopus TaxID=2862362 RepID=A0AAW0ARC6_9AGAR